MPGRINRKRREAALSQLPPPRTALGAQAAALWPVCPLCERPIPPSQQDAHHLVPKSRGGVHTVLLHRVCHRQIHALLTETELARHYSDIAALLEHPELSRFVRWVRTKPADFFERSRKSRRIRRG